MSAFFTRLVGDVLPWNPEVFSLTDEHEVKRERTSLGPLNAPIQSDAVIEVSVSDFDLVLMCAHRGSLAFRPPLRLTLVRERENLWVPDRDFLRPKMSRRDMY